MKKGNQTTLKLAIDKLLRTYNLGERMDELDLMDKWEETMGRTISRRTKNLRLKNRILTIELDSSVLREELLMRKTDLIAMLNEKAEKNIIDDILFR